jgi:hypothetical protein
MMIDDFTAEHAETAEILPRRHKDAKKLMNDE